MTCPNCGSLNPEDRPFCGQCGTRLFISCPNCGTHNPPTNRFCGNCGTRLDELATTLEAVPERRLVTVLFADLVGFTPFAEARDAEEVREVLTRYFERAAEVVERFGGLVEKYIGDAVMAVWGATLAREDDAERAVRAALELVDMVAKLGADLGLPGLALRAGVLTGEASVGPGGNTTGMVVGDLVNTASRLQAVAQPGSVLVGETTFNLVKDSVLLAPIEPLILKGKSEPVAAFRAERVLGVRGGRYRAIEAPFVGRDDELRMLKDLLHATGRERRARLVSIIGQAGIGKSRLIWEFEKYVDGVVEEIYWHRGRSPSFGDGVAFWALAEMVRTRAGIVEDDDPPASKAKLASATELVAKQDRAWVESHLAALLGLGPAPEGERSEQFAAFRTFFEAIASLGTTVLVFEDHHWADPALLDFVEELTDWSRDHPVLVVTLARPDLLERRPGWGSGRQGFISLHLGALTDSTMRTLVTGLVPGIPDSVAEQVVERANGVPLYAIEVVRKMIQDGDLIEEEEGCFCAVVGDLEHRAVPESLQALIGARLDQLAVDERSLLQDAAVLGSHFGLEALAAVSDLPIEDVKTKLASLVRKELLDLVRDELSGRRYRFVQGLIKEVAYGRLSREVRRARHLAAARHFASLGDHELAGLVSAHYLEAYRATPAGPPAEALRIKAREALTEAAKRAASLHSYEQALDLTTKALEIASDGAERFELWLMAAKALGQLARLDDAVNRALAAHQWAMANGDRLLQVKAARALAQAYNDGHRADESIVVLEPLVGGSIDLTASPILVSGAAELARSYMLANRTEQALEAVDAALQAAEALELMGTATDAMVTKGTLLGEAGRPLEGQALLKESLQVARQHGFHGARSRALNNLAILVGEADPPAAASIIGEALAEAIRLGDRGKTVWHSISLAQYYLGTGRLQLARQYLEDPAMEHRQGFYDVAYQLSWSRFYELSGDAEAARLHFENASKQAAGIADPMVSGEMVIHEGISDLTDGRYEQAFDTIIGSYRAMAKRTAAELLPCVYAAGFSREARLLSELGAALSGLRPRSALGHQVERLRAAIEAAREGKDVEAVATGEAVAGQWNAWDDHLNLVMTNLTLAANLGDQDLRERLTGQAEQLITASGLLGLQALFEDARSRAGQIPSVAR